MIQFFLEFVLRNEVFSEYTTEFKKALEACKLARIELPHTDVMGKALPGKFNDGCVALFGDLANKHVNTGFDFGIATQEDRDSKRRKLDGEDEKDLQQFKETAKEANLQFIDGASDNVDHDVEMVKDAVADNVDINGADAMPVSPGGDATHADGGVTSSWGNIDTTNGWATDPDQDTTGWAPVIESTGPWGSNVHGWFGDIKKGVFEVMGPTVFPLTHTTGIVEDSVRRIAKITPPSKSYRSSSSSKKSKRTPHPAEAVEGEFPRRLAQVVMAPYKRNGNHVNSDIVTPSILSDSRGATTAEPSSPAIDKPGVPKPHDPLQDEITVLFDEETAEKLKEGMGIRGTWVQLVRIDTSNTEPEPVGMEKKGGPGWNGQPTKYWFLGKALANLVSFHTDKYYPNQD